MQRKGRNCRGDAFKSRLLLQLNGQPPGAGCFGAETGGRGDADGAEKFLAQLLLWCPIILGVIEAMADRVLVMRNGEMLEYGETRKG